MVDASSHSANHCGLTAPLSIVVESFKSSDELALKDRMFRG
jgi:hypothetical protein